VTGAGRYPGSFAPRVAEGWSLARLTPPSRLYGANGLRAGPDGRLYVAQVVGSQVSAIDIATGEIEPVAPIGGDIIGPDDLAFDASGNLFVTEFTEGRVSVRTPNGGTRVLHGQVPGANPITWHQGRLFAGELRPEGRILEFDLNGGEPRVVLDAVPMANAFEVGPDGRLYFPVMGTNEIWRVDLAGGDPEVVTGALAAPNSVKFDAQGRILSTQAATGEVLRIDPQTGRREVLATIAPGLDNLAFAGERLFVSSISGRIHEVLADGQVAPLVPHGFNFPLGLASDPAGGVCVADGGFVYRLSPRGDLLVLGHLFSAGGPGYVRGIEALGTDELIVTTGMGEVVRWRPEDHSHDVLVAGLDRLCGVGAGPGGAIVCAEAGAGRVLQVEGGAVQTLARDLLEPMDVAFTAEGCFVSEAGAGRVVKLSGGRVETVIDGLQRPQGLTVWGGRLYVLDAGARKLVERDLASGAEKVLAQDLPVGPPPGVTPKLLRGIPPFTGPMFPFAGLTAGADGTLYISADGEGSVLALAPV
jgi:sugar lactone lactonase YvrE